VLSSRLGEEQSKWEMRCVRDENTLSASREVQRTDGEDQDEGCSVSEVDNDVMTDTRTVANVVGGGGSGEKE
jgi:hypothetical protein